MIEQGFTIDEANTVPVGEMPTQILGLADDDEHRTRLVAALAKEDRPFESHWQDPEKQDALRDDMFTHFTDKAKGLGALGVVQYVKISNEAKEANPVAAKFKKAEMALRRLVSPTVRRAIREGVIDK